MKVSAQKPVSLIVLTWNGLEVTRRCVQSVLEVTDHPSFELVVVDNGSTDGTLEYLRGVAGIRLVENGRNLGFVAGNNAGIRATTTDVVLMNNDTEVTRPDWLARMQEAAYSADDVGVVGCRLVNADGRLVHAGTYMPVPSFWGQEYPGDELDIGQYARDRDVDGVIFACAYIKREVIDRVGPLDEDYFSYYEDTDYCLKASAAGYRVVCCGGSTVLHLENASTDMNRLDFSGTFKRSREVFLSKWKDRYDALYGRRLTWHSFISGPGAYARMSARLLWALDSAGVDVNLGFLEGADKAELADFRVNDMKNRGADRNRPQVLFGPPEMLSRADGSYNIGYVFTPFDRFEGEAVREMNRMDEVWVHSEFQRECARASGVKRDVVVMPSGVDPDYFHPGVTGYRLPGRFTFLAPLDWGPGAACETLLRAFTDEFDATEKVVLVMKVASPSPGGEVEEAVEAMGLPSDRAPVVFVLDHDVPHYQRGCLLRSADCLVMPLRAQVLEPLAAEALACGVPVVATGWGAEPALFDSASAFAVDYALVGSPQPGARWAEPDYGHLRSMLRRVVEEAETVRGSALEASGIIRGSRGWEVLAAKVVERLDSIA